MAMVGALPHALPQWQISRQIMFLLGAFLFTHPSTFCPICCISRANSVLLTRPVLPTHTLALSPGQHYGLSCQAGVPRADSQGDFA